ncbi:hypothetical protein [Snodgrassella communis]|uniref:hypothetical protein n=1 Tax=Snodgrassella communis TaxID=2946699 RepID=UPI001EF52722|nr:hypothetical protein [Snodgrassella communis]
MSALSQIKQPLSSLHLFHSDRGKEFAKQLFGKASVLIHLIYSVHSVKRDFRMTMQWQKQHLKALKLNLLKEKNS